jgi:hypothetical protein
MSTSPCRRNANPRLRALDQRRRQVEPVPLDKDVFGDGSVWMPAAPGAYTGSSQRPRQLRQTAAAAHRRLAHFTRTTTRRRAATTTSPPRWASLDRFKKIAANSKALVIIQHDARDVSKLPAFPAAAK